MKEESQRIRRISSSTHTQAVNASTASAFSREDILAHILSDTAGTVANNPEYDATTYQQLLADLTAHLVDVKYRWCWTIPLLLVSAVLCFAERQWTMV